MANLKTTMTVYNWVFKFVGAALLIGLALVLYLMNLEVLVEAFVGFLILGYAIMRLVPFIRTQSSDLIKTINVIEIILNIMVALVFIGNAITTGETLGALFGYLFAAVLLGRGMVHFYGISYGTEKGDHPTYFFHIATLIIGTIIVVEGWEVQHLIYLMLFLSLAAGGFLGYDAYGGYNLYRKRKQLEEGKSKEAPQPEVSVPRKEDPAKDQDQIVS